MTNKISLQKPLKTDFVTSKINPNLLFSKLFNFVTP